MLIRFFLNKFCYDDCMKKILTVATLLCAISTPSWSQNNTPLPLFDSYIKSNTLYIATVENKFKNIFSLAAPDCNNEVTIKRLKPQILVSPTFNLNNDIQRDKDDNSSTNNNNHPDYGQWIEKSVVSGCDTSIRLNVISIAYDSNSIPSVYPLMNGRTRIDPIHQIMAEKSAHDTLRNTTECSVKGMIHDTQFIGYRTENNTISETDQNLGWFEQWTIKACNTNHAINMAVLPDPRTRYRFVAKVR